jgi:hypothetical protein
MEVIVVFALFMMCVVVSYATYRVIHMDKPKDLFVNLKDSDVRDLK